MIVHILKMRTSYFVHVSYFFHLWGVLTLGIFSPEMLRECLFCLIFMKLQQYSFLYIQTLHTDCSHIEDVHLLFCARFIFFLIFWRVLNLDIFSIRNA